MRKILLSIIATVMATGLVSNIYALTNEQVGMLANEAANLLDRSSDITNACTFATLGAGGNVPKECGEYVLEMRNALKPIIEKYEGLNSYSSGLGSQYGNTYNP
jgi:hypothetical protein